MDPSTFNILSLCAGIGGIDLGLRLAIPEARTICYAEIEISAVEILVARMEDGSLDEAPVWTEFQEWLHTHGAHSEPALMTAAA